jgi:nucleoside-diphosphate-sugar epimerase
MNVVITGGSGFLGQRLARRLLQRGTLRDAEGRDQRIDRITLVDVVESPTLADQRVTSVVGDIADRSLLDRTIDDKTATVFHLAAVVSGMAEADFDLGMRINVDASRTLLEVCRAHGQCPRLVFTSSVAVYGGTLPDVVVDSTAVRPQTSYGVEKAIVELLIHDFTRKGFVDGRIFRLPTITVRPGRPNAAASSFASGIIREPLNGEAAICPVDPETPVWLLSPATAIECLIAGHDLPASVLGMDRSVNLPGLSVRVSEMVAALERVAGADVVTRIKWERDPRIERIVLTWPGRIDTSRARALGFPADDNFDAIVRRYIEDANGRHSSTMTS